MHTGFWWGNLRKRPIGRRRHTQGGNIKMALKEVDWGGMDRIDVAVNRNR